MASTSHYPTKYFSWINARIIDWLELAYLSLIDSVYNACPMFFDQAFNTSYIVAFIMGLFTSMHCVGMCGSIIGTLTLSLNQKIRGNKAHLSEFVFSYNAGRITSYTLAGFIAGMLNHVLAFPFGEEGYRVLQILSATFMAGAGLYIAGWFPVFAYVEKLGSFFWRKIEPIGRSLIPVNNLIQAFVFGMIWGWLPCGLVYVAVALAATTGDLVRSTFTMFAFGLGTLPAVMGMGIMAGTLARLSRMQRFKELAGVFLIILALFAAFPGFYPLKMEHF